MRTLVAIALIAALAAPAAGQAADASTAARCSTAGLTPQEQQLAAQAAAASAAQIPPDATVGDCSVSGGAVDKPPNAHADDNGGSGQVGSIACAVLGQPYYQSSPTYVHLLVNWSCSAYYVAMSGTAVVRDTAKDWNQRRSDWAGTEHLEFSGILWYGFHNRPVYECPVYFAFRGVGFLRVCTNVAFI
jgi:hypothetical protein